MPRFHSCWVGSISRMKPCRCLTTPASTAFSRSSRQFAKLAMTAAGGGLFGEVGGHR